MTSEEMSEREALEMDGIPEFMSGDWDWDVHPDCPDCGSDKVSWSSLNEDGKRACYSCGYFLDGGEGKKPPDEESSEEGVDQEEARKNADLNAAAMVSMLGLLFCLTIIGIPIGVVLLYLGARMEPDEDEDSD